MINTTCHGCKSPMSFQAVPVDITELSGERKTFYGHSDSIWICKTCREDASKLKAARIAAGMPPKPILPAEFSEEDY